MSKSSPQRAPNAVGVTLRRFRERAGLSTRELARRTGVTTSYVSKVELGQLGAQREFCARAARALGLPRAERDMLNALLALSLAEYRPVTSSAQALQQAQRAVRQLELGCRSCKVFQLSMIPGLLQTKEYAQSIFSRLGAGHRSTAAVTERMARQKILEDRRRSFQFLLSDWAIAPHWCSDRVMAGQRRRLRRLATRTNINIRVLPHGFSFPNDVPPLVTGFDILDEAVVIVDTLNGFTTYRQPEEVAAYTQVFDEVFPHVVRLKLLR